MLIIARHGRTVANAGGLLQGRVDNPLDELGHRQASAIAAAVVNDVGMPDRIIASPLLRARETAAAFELLGETDGVAAPELEIDERWIELDYGVWDERPVGEVTAAEWAAWRADPGFAPPGGESLASLNRRISDACDDLVEVATNETVVVVCHVSPIKSAIRWALGVDDELSWRLNVAQASISRIAMRGAGAAVTSFNEVHHLAHL